ncbi:hypothetical protein ACIQPR_45165 [Streptomyces sp. NPDC091280]|uniref:hypothetical protein n=1 Tax=Streptomyces sp. NPDC091280 TaxID=3365984 RepID=UPI0038225F95
MAATKHTVSDGYEHPHYRRRRTMMPVVHLTTSYPEYVWELHTPTDVVARAEALDGEIVRICRITVPLCHRGHGYASLLLRAVLDHFPDVTVGLAASPPPAAPGLDRTALRAWYARHGFVPAPLRNDPHRMLRPPAPGSSPAVSDASRMGS